MKSLILIAFLVLSNLAWAIPNVPPGYTLIGWQMNSYSSATAGDLTTEVIVLKNNASETHTRLSRTTYSDNNGNPISVTQVEHFVYRTFEHRTVEVKVGPQLSDLDEGAIDSAMNNKLKSLDTTKLPTIQSLQYRLNNSNVSNPLDSKEFLDFLCRQHSVLNQVNAAIDAATAQQKANDLQRALENIRLAGVHLAFQELSNSLERENSKGFSASAMLSNALLESMKLAAAKSAFAGAQPNLIIMDDAFQRSLAQEIENSLSTSHPISSRADAIKSLLSPLQESSSQTRDLKNKILYEIEKNLPALQVRTELPKSLLGHQAWSAAIDLAGSIERNPSLAAGNRRQILSAAQLILNKGITEDSSTDIENAAKVAGFLSGRTRAPKVTTDFTGGRYNISFGDGQSISSAASDRQLTKNLFLSALDHTIGHRTKSHGLRPDLSARANRAIDLSLQQSENNQSLSGFAKELFSQDGLTEEDVTELATTIADVALGLVPVVNVGKDLYEAGTGRSLLTGKPLSDIERALAVAGVLTAGGSSSFTKVLAKLEKASPALSRAVSHASRMMGDAGTWASQLAVSGLGTIKTRLGEAWLSSAITQNTKAAFALGQNLVLGGPRFSCELLNYSRDLNLSLIETAHLSRFRNGFTKFFSQADYHDFVMHSDQIKGKGETMFVTAKESVHDLLSKSPMTRQELEAALSMKENYFKNGAIYRADIPFSTKFEPRLPNGLEAGANDYFKSGGFTAGGLPEVVIKPVDKNLTVITTLGGFQ